jgi:proteasome lid subunit RPN8/RPN11
MTLVLSAEVLRRMQEHGQQTYPEECGGLLLGEMTEPGVRLVTSVLPLENHREEMRERRVELSPLDYARAERQAARQGLGVWGFYHSHPDHPAVPSQYDLDHAAFLDWSYTIIPVAGGQARTARSWVLREDRSAFTEEEILLRGE